MTLIGAIDLGGRILFASDGIVMHSNDEGMTDASEEADKIWSHPAMNVVWGFSGGAPTGLTFNEWFRSHSSETWDDLVREVIEHLATLNGEARRTAALAEAPPAPACVLAAGYFGTDARIIQFDTDGGQITVPPSVPVFSGGGNGPALAAWLALRKAPTHPDFDEEHLFRVAFEAAVFVHPACGPPLRFVEVKP